MRAPDGARHRKHKLTIDKLINRFEATNRTEGKNPKTVIWYTQILCQFKVYLKTNNENHKLVIDYVIIDVSFK